MINQYTFTTIQNELAALPSLGPGGVNVVNLESPSGAGARLASRPGMSSSDSADVKAAQSVASRVVFSMMLVTMRCQLEQTECRWCWAEWPFQVIQVFHASICHSSDDALSPVRPPSLGCKAIPLIRCRVESILT